MNIQHNLNTLMTPEQIRSLAKMGDVSEEIVETIAHDWGATIGDVQTVYTAIMCPHDPKEVVKRTRERHPEADHLHWNTLYGRVA